MAYLVVDKLTCLIYGETMAVEPTKIDPPICPACKGELRNLSTREGKRIFQCVTLNCNNNRWYNEKGDKVYDTNS